MKSRVNWLAQTHAACFTYPRPWSAVEFGDLLASPGAILVTQDNGFALARAALDEAEILTIAVLPDSRKRGIGRALLADLEAQLSARKIRYLHLEVSAANTAALALYYASGFTESGRRSGYYGTPGVEPVDALILSKTL